MTSERPSMTSRRGPEMTEQMWQQQQELLRQQQLCWVRNSTPAHPHSDGLFCPLTFDGIACWDPTPAGTVATQPCPHYFQGFLPQYAATRECTTDGSWYFSSEHNRSWTDYSRCHLPSILDKHLDYTDNQLIQVWTPVIKTISRVGYGISLSALLLAMLIFCSIRKLRACPRTNLHTHLFLSFILKAAMWIAMDSVPRESLDPAYTRSWLCKLVTAVWHYFIMANYSWVTMEGLYLFCLIYLALFSDHSSITAYVLIGWGFPVCFVVPWVVVRALLEDIFCWRVNINDSYFWIIRAPTILLILVNAILFVCIVHVLLQKLNSSISVETRRYRKLARSTLVLIPLFGFHYVVFVGLSAFMNINPVLELIWLFVDQLFASFQGFFVAILYCFMSSEVKQEVSKHWAVWRCAHFAGSSASGAHRHNNGKNCRSTGRSSVQSSTLLDRPYEFGAGRGSRDSDGSRHSPRQLTVTEVIREDEAVERQQLMPVHSSATGAAERASADDALLTGHRPPTIAVEPPSGGGTIWDWSPADDVTVKYDGIDGVRIQTNRPAGHSTAQAV